jgi:hypothetical protein
VNWEEAAVTTVILGFGPLKLADRAWFAVQTRLNSRRDRRIQRAEVQLKEVRAWMVDHAAKLEREAEIRRVTLHRTYRFVSSGYPVCHCGHESYEHLGGGRCCRTFGYGATGYGVECGCLGCDPEGLIRGYP